MIDKIIEELEKIKADIDSDNEILSLITRTRNTAIYEAIEIVKKYENDGWISVDEKLPNSDLPSGKSDDILITLGWFYNDGSFNSVEDNLYIGYFDNGLYKDYISCVEEERLEMEEILNDCWNVYAKGRRVTIDLTNNRKVIAWKLPQPYKGE